MKFKALTIISIVGLTLTVTKPARAVFVYQARSSNVEVAPTNFEPGLRVDESTMGLETFTVSFDNMGAFMDQFGANTGQYSVEQSSNLGEFVINAELFSRSMVEGNRAPAIRIDNDFTVEFEVIERTTFLFGAEFNGNIVNAGAVDFVNVSFQKLSGPEPGFGAFSSLNPDDRDLPIIGQLFPENRYRLRVVANADAIGKTQVSQSSASAFVLTAGVTEAFPRLPDKVEANRFGLQSFIFNDQRSAQWFDPPLASGFRYDIVPEDTDSFFTGI